MTFLLNQDGCAGGCGIGLTNFATVTISDQGTYVLVTESFNSSLTPAPGFVKTGAGDAIEFQLLHAATSITNITSGFSALTGAQSASTFGSFSNGIHCDICGNGASNPYYGTLLFHVNGVTMGDFVANGSSEYFASDIIGTTRKTGNVAANAMASFNSTTAVATPEPGTLGLSLSFLTFLGALRLARHSGRRGRKPIF